MGGVAWSWIVLLGLVTLAVVGGTCRGIDAGALEVAQSVHPPALDLAASLVGVLGQSEVTLGIALGLAVARFRAYPRDALVPLFIVVTIAVEAALKMLVPQAPPPQERSRAVELLPLFHAPFAYSFPSGHVARAAFLLRIAHGVPTWAVLLGVAIMAATRVYLGEHWLSDTIGGAILGIGVASIARSRR
ncbi:MAG TPA: phosphatase PAP2 family protein [Candidatus Limnocylindria bacterium]|nr:phosphatase PAP2 family protein [Candidatus Limnocylindria bacterium]